MTPSAAKPAINLATFPEDRLLQQRLRDLPVTIDGTWIERCIQKLYRELDARHIAFHPPCYLADEWLCPEGNPVIGIPFVLIHPRLKQLELRFMGEAEGGTARTLMQLLRHETGHALMYAYRLNRRRAWREHFGSSSKAYPDVYRIQLYSKAFVRHLPDSYAQSHPDEDFAETFAVWLTPNADWRAQYKGWKVMHKLEYVNKLMAELVNTPPVVKPTTTYRYRVDRSTVTLGKYYHRKRREYREWFRDFHDPALTRLFATSRASGQQRKASAWLKQHHKLLRGTVARWTGERRYTITRILDDMATRCDELSLHVAKPESEMVSEVTAYVARLAMNYHYTHSFAGHS